MGIDGDLGRWKSEMYDNSMTQAGKELVDSGFIFVAAAGNSGQMQVNPDDPNYDNILAMLSTKVYMIMNLVALGTMLQEQLIDADFHNI